MSVCELRFSEAWKGFNYLLKYPTAKIENYSHSIPFSELCYSFPHLHDISRDVLADNCILRELTPERDTSLDLPIHWVQRCSLNLDENLTGSGFVDLDIPNGELLCFRIEEQGFLFGWRHKFVV